MFAAKEGPVLSPLPSGCFHYAPLSLLLSLSVCECFRVGVKSLLNYQVPAKYGSSA